MLLLFFLLTKRSIHDRLTLEGRLIIDRMEVPIMEYRKLGVIETRFAELIWRHAPISSGELVKLCQQELEWKKSTTYTVLKKLCEQGLFQNEAGVVTPIVSREEFYSVESEKFVEETFQGSLPAFLAAFTARKSLSEKEIAEIRRMIDKIGEG